MSWCCAFMKGWGAYALLVEKQWQGAREGGKAGGGGQGGRVSNKVIHAVGAACKTQSASKICSRVGVMLSCTCRGKVLTL